MFPSREMDYMAEIYRLFPKTNENDLQPTSIFSSTYSQSPINSMFANRSSSSADSTSPDSYPDLFTSFQRPSSELDGLRYPETPRQTYTNSFSSRTQRPIVGRKILSNTGHSEPSMIDRINEHDVLMSNSWIDDFSLTKSRVFEQSNQIQEYKLFPEKKSPTTFNVTTPNLSPITSNFSPVKSNLSATASNFSPIESNFSTASNFSPIKSNLSPTVSKLSPINSNFSAFASNFSSNQSNLSPTVSNISPINSNFSAFASNFSAFASNFSPNQSNLSPTVSKLSPINSNFSAFASNFSSNQSNLSPTVSNISPINSNFSAFASNFSPNQSNLSNASNFSQKEYNLSPTSNFSQIESNLSPVSNFSTSSRMANTPSSPKLIPDYSPNIMTQHMPEFTLPNYSTAGPSKIDEIASPKMCKFCRKNGETPLVYMTHFVKQRIGKKNIVTCPILRSHVCTACGATGDNAHTITYCPLVRSSNNGKRLESTTITLKNTRIKSNGKRRY